VTGRSGPGRLVAVGVAVLLTPAAVVGAAATGLTQLPGPAAPSPVAAADVPAALLGLYQRSAALCPGVSWTVLAGIGKLESDHNRPAGQHSSAGAAGPMQFLPSTWTRYGLDGDHDGTANPFDPADAVPATALYLCALGATRDTPRAVAAYTCGALPACQASALAPGGYAARVLTWADRYADAGSPATPGAAIAVQTALGQVGTPYLWGGESPTGFDCSGLVQYAYHHAGTTLPRTAQSQHDAGPLLAPGTEAAPGDLVFFGQDSTHIHHVGIALGQGRMVDAPHTGALVRVEPIAGFGDYLGATRPAPAGHA